MKRFKIFVGRDWYNDRPLYKVIDKVGDYVGEWHKSRKEAQEELKDLMRSVRKNRSLRKNEGLGYTSYIPESGFLVAKTTGYHDTPSGKFQLLKKGQVLRILFTTKERRGGGTTGKEYFVAETTDHPYEGMKVLLEKGYAGKIYNSDPRKSSSRYGNRLMGNRGLTPRQQKMLDFLKRVYPQYSELARDSATKKDASRLARLKLIKVRSFKRTGTSRGKRFSMMIMEARAMAPKGGQLSSPVLGLARNPMRSFASLHPSDRAKLNRFSDYVNSFYGKGGVYARDFKNGGFDRKTIERAIMVYIDDVRKGKVEWGDGDSIDRERVRTILEPSYSMFIPEGKMTIRKNRRR